MRKYLRKAINMMRYFDVKDYKPHSLNSPAQLLDIPSAWQGHELIIEDLMQRFRLNNNVFLEFGVEFGYSAVAFSNYFKEVIGVDIFMGDVHTLHKGDHYEQTQASLQSFPNIKLYKSDYKQWIVTDTQNYDLIHVDIVHSYRDTYDCGYWSAQHSKCTIFHDTESFPEVKRAVRDIARKTGKIFYNYPEHYGLGIVV